MHRAAGSRCHLECVAVILLATIAAASALAQVSQSTSTTSTVEPPPPPPLLVEADHRLRRHRVRSPPGSASLTLGSLGRLTCHVENLDRVLIGWRFNGQVIPLEQHQLLEDSGQVLLIPGFQDSDVGDYECVVTDKNCEAADSTADAGACQETHRARLSLKRPSTKPTFVESPTDQAVAVGADASFACKATGHPEPRIRWAMKGRTHTVLLSNSAKYKLLPGLLIVRNVSNQDCLNTYYCWAENSRGRDEVTFRLAVLEPSETSLFASDAATNSSSSSSPGSELEAVVREAIERAKTRVNQAIDRTLGKLKDPLNRRSPSDILTLFRLPKETAIELTKSREIYESAYREVIGLIRAGKVRVTGATGATDFPNYELDPQLLALIAQLTGCQTHARDNSQCHSRMCFHLRYRSFDGTCNNLDNPWFGASNTPLKRLLSPQYENGMDDPVGWSMNRTYGGFPKPSARLISQRLLRAVNPTVDATVSSMTMQWGQFLDHDLDFTPVDPADSTFLDGRRCNDTCINEPPCFPIPVYPDDIRIRHRPCIGFVRSSATCGSGVSSLFVGSRPYFREQLNQITAFIDASNVYGSTESEARDVRELGSDRGFLKEGMPTAVPHRRLLPFSTSQPVDCQIDPGKRHIPCFLAGDHRANEQLGLTALHTVWMREHNRLASGLRRINPHWSGDKVFFEARKIVGAMHMHITFSHWLPTVLGPAGASQLGRYKGYDPGVDPSIANVFATAAMRFGHTLINPVLHRLNASYEDIPQGSLRLHQAFFAPHRLIAEGGIDPILRGLVGRGAKLVVPSQPLNTELTERLFQLAHDVALDLAALNIQRGRDHGLPGYNAWRVYCGRLRAESFDDLRWSVRSPDLREKMRAVYGHPDNVDLFAGMVAEDPVEGALMGPTTMCLMLDQMRRLRDGDRFWYESEDQFSRAQLAQIKQVSLARVICDNGDGITEMQPDVFQLPGQRQNRRVPCGEIRGLNLNFWKECLSDSNDAESAAGTGQPPGRRLRRDATGNCGVDQVQNQVQQLQQQVAALSEQVEQLKQLRSSTSD